MEFEKTIDLPSGGLLEGSRKSLQVGSMDMLAEKVIYTKSLLPSEKLIKIVGMCSDASPEELRGFPFSDLAFAFIQIRILSTESTSYSFRVQCSMCQEGFPQEVDFEELEYKSLEEVCDGDAPEPFTVSLPASGKDVQLRYLRVSDHVTLEKMQKVRRSKGIVTDERFLCETLARRTSSIDGEEGREILYVKFYESLKTKDGYRIKDALDKRDFGIDLSIEGICPHCGELDTYLVRMDASFFRPGDRNDGEAP